MVDISQKVKQIVEEYIEPGYYFAINRGRQYGKTTTLYQLEKYLQDQYMIISISFEGADDLFDSRENFVRGFAQLVTKELENESLDANVIEQWNHYEEDELTFRNLGDKTKLTKAQAIRYFFLFSVYFETNTWTEKREKRIFFIT